MYQVPLSRCPSRTSLINKHLGLDAFQLDVYTAPVLLCSPSFSANQTTAVHHNTMERPIAMASATMAAPYNGIHSSESMPYTCLTCTRRKVKCDKLSPICSTCHKSKLECSYQAPPPRKGKRKMSGDLNDKLAYYERILQQNGLLTGDPGSSAPSVEAPKQQSQSDGPHDEMKQVGKLLSGEGTTRYIDSSLWRNLGEDEMSRIVDEVDDDAEEEEVTGATPDDVLTGDPLSGAFLGMSQNLLVFHPSTAHAQALWQTHIESVEPTFKVLHIPTVSAMLQTTSAHPYYATKADECILFAIYHFAVVSLTDHDCQRTFGQQREVLRKRYHDALRQALVNASFLRTTQLPVLQSLTLYLMSTRHQNDANTFWILTGTAMRIAQRMGLHKDGESLGLPPYDVQIRRRLFHQIVALDGYASQISGTGITIESGAWDCKQPLNINDDQIWPGMTQPPKEQKGATEMIFFLARAELATWHLGAMAGKIGKSPPHKAFSSEACEGAKVDGVDELEASIETKYLRYCDISNPLHTLLLMMSRSYINAARLRTMLPSLRANTASDEERRQVCNIASRIIDTDSAAFVNPGLKRFMWHIKTFFQWDALICMLVSMTKPGLFAATELNNCWRRIETVFKNHGEVLQRNRMLNASVGRITMEAWDANPPSFAAGGDPTFVQALRTLHARIEEKRRGNTGRGFTGRRSTQNTTPVDSLPSGEFKSLEQSADGMDFGFGNDFTFDSADFLFWDKLIEDYQNMPEDQSATFVQ
jgi:hypothetical protein